MWIVLLFILYSHLLTKWDTKQDFKKQGCTNFTPQMFQEHWIGDNKESTFFLRKNTVWEQYFKLISILKNSLYKVFKFY